LQARTDKEMSDELKQVAQGFRSRVETFTVYDVNGYRFRTRSYEDSRPTRKTTCSGVRTSGNDNLDYYGIVEEIYELHFEGMKELKPVVFKCHWFDPNEVRRQDDIGQVEIRQDSVYAGEDVYIVAQQATQVYYLPWACQDDKRLKGWFLVHSVSPRGKLPVPTDDDYNFDPTADNGEFYIPEGLNGHLSIDIESLMDMKVDNEVDEDEGEVVQDPEDIIMLEKWRACRELGVEDSTAQARKDFQWSDSDDDDDDDDDSDDVEPTTIVRGDAF